MVEAITDTKRGDLSIITAYKQKNKGIKPLFAYYEVYEWTQFFLKEALHYSKIQQMRFSVCRKPCSLILYAKNKTLLILFENFFETFYYHIISFLISNQILHMI